MTRLHMRTNATKPTEPKTLERKYPSTTSVKNTAGVRAALKMFFPSLSFTKFSKDSSISFRSLSKYSLLNSLPPILRVPWNMANEVSLACWCFFSSSWGAKYGVSPPHNWNTNWKQKDWFQHSYFSKIEYSVFYPEHSNVKSKRRESGKRFGGLSFLSQRNVPLASYI